MKILGFRRSGLLRIGFHLKRGTCKVEGMFRNLELESSECYAALLLPSRIKAQTVALWVGEGFLFTVRSQRHRSCGVGGPPNVKYL
jgi:hypothetical protein